VSGPAGCEQLELQSSLLDVYIPLEKKELAPVRQKRKRVLIIAGPTGAGKTDLSLHLAKQMNGEVISADSMQIYRGMDIGTAKINVTERGDIPHHLIDVRDVHEAYNVVDFYYEARHMCEQVHARGNLPIIVGGAGFYLRTLLYGPPGGPPSIASLRTSLEKEMDEKGADTLYERLQKKDAIYAGKITVRDRQKIVRALEIMELTGEKVSDQKYRDEQRPLDYDFHCWFIHRSRETLYEIINKRCDAMIEGGLVDEVRALDRAGLRQNSSAAQAIGYKHILEFLDSPQTPQDFEYFREKFKTASRRYAKRQFTWFRREPLFRWLNLELHDIETAIDIIIQEFDSRL
jgi:tRNA dimethylallyltransferase